jgi:hypothetical protein
MGTLSNYKLDGYCDFVLEFIYKNDLATTKSEALRDMIRKRAGQIGVPDEKEYLETIALERKYNEITAGRRSGKTKTISEKDFIKACPEAKEYLG